MRSLRRGGSGKCEVRSGGCGASARASRVMANEWMARVCAGCSIVKTVADADGWTCTVQQAGAGWFSGEWLGQSVDGVFA